VPGGTRDVGFEDQDHSNSFSAKAGPLDDRDFTVGAGLLANAFCQSTYSYLIHLIRQQAGSYRKMHSVSQHIHT
jgi:hypothetical protein